MTAENDRGQLAPSNAEDAMNYNRAQVYNTTASSYVPHAYMHACTSGCESTNSLRCTSPLPHKQKFNIAEIQTV